MKKGESFIYDSISDAYKSVMDNKLYYVGLACCFYVIYLLYDIGKPSRNTILEGYSNEKLHPSNIKESIKELKKTNTVIRDDLHVGKYKSEYEDYLIQLYDYINLVALEECVKPNPDITVKMETLKDIDTRYTPLKDMINQSMKTLNEAYDSSKK